MGLTITHEDNMNLMSRYPDNYFNLALVDPQYGINAHKGIGKSGRLAVKKNNMGGGEKWDKEVPGDEFFKELFRVSKHQIIFGGNYFEQLPTFNPKLKRIPDFKDAFDKGNCIIWDKGETMYARDFNEAELAYSTLGGGWFKLSPLQENRIHQTQKPVKLYKWLLHNFAKPDDKILDTHLGSGSIAIACLDYNYELIACEKNKAFYEKAMERINNHHNQGKLFHL